VTADSYRAVTADSHRAVIASGKVRSDVAITASSAIADGSVNIRRPGLHRHGAYETAGPRTTRANTNLPTRTVEGATFD